METAAAWRPRRSVAASSTWRGGIAWIPIVVLLVRTAVGPIPPVGLGVLGVIALRTGSLILPIALHAALDIPIYYANACLRS